MIKNPQEKNLLPPLPMTQSNTVANLIMRIKLIKSPFMAILIFMPMNNEQAKHLQTLLTNVICQLEGQKFLKIIQIERKAG